MGTDLGGVRVHRGDQASAAARSVGALAYTHGSHVVFGSGQWAPGSQAGRRLLAHELAHVVQQSGGSPSLALSAVGDRVQRVPIPAQSPAADDKPQPPPLPAQKPTATPLGQTMVFENVTLGTNTDYVMPVLRDYIAKHGESEAKDFRDRLRDHIFEQIPESDRIAIATAERHRAVPTGPLSNNATIYVAVYESLDAILWANKKWLDDFEAQAKQVVLGMLQDSEDRVNEERIRYGVSWETVMGTRWGMGKGGAPIPYRTPITQYAMKDTPGSRALAEAATGILTRKRAFDAAQDTMEQYGKDVVGGALGEMIKERHGNDADRKQLAHLNELRAARNLAKRDLDVFRIQKSTEFPILAAYTSDEKISERDLETLQELAKGESPRATYAIGSQIKARLQDIASVRKDITEHDGEDTKIWRVPRIIAGTRALTGATPGTMYGRLVDDKIKDEAPGVLTSILLGLLQLVLVIAAPFTGGLTLIPAAAISVGQAYVHFREYERAQLLRGTDFGALALSSEDPSLFWLAVDIIGAGFDVGAAAGAAVKLFRALAPAARAARSARTAEQIEHAAQDLERTARELGGETLAKSVGRDARVGSTASKVGETADEANALARAGEQMAKTELVAAEAAESIAGRMVKVSEAGGIWSCASPCTLLRERYRGLLRRKGTNWETRLKALEDEAARIPKGKAGAAARQQVAERAAGLEREMRTAAMPGEWTSPLSKGTAADVAEFKDMVKRRGSVAAELDHHPPNWTGKDEARFRYGKSVEAEPNYRWTLDENGGLRYDRTDINLPERQFNPATGEFEEAAEGANIIRATKGPQQTVELGKLSRKQQGAMKAAFEKRAKLIAERDRLEALDEAGKLGDKGGERLRKLYGEVNEESRQLGENAAAGVMTNKGGKKLYPLGKPYSTAGDFDQVWQVGNELYIVEAKGGSSGLGSRALKSGAHAEQGTREYAMSVAENMARNGATKEIRALGDRMRDLIKSGKIKYVLVRAPVGEEAGRAVLRDVQVSEFVLR
jgi:hypothetical protein